MLYKDKPQIVLIAVSIDGEDVTEPRYIAGNSVEEVLAVIDAAFPAAEPQSQEAPKKVRKPRRTKAAMLAATSAGEVNSNGKDKVWA